MSELRKDTVTGRWVIIATERGDRPGAYIEGTEPRSGGFCPFCEGNEHLTPPELLAFRKKTQERDGKGWWVRVVPNKYPAVRLDGAPRRLGEGMYDMMTGVGAHEVVVETADHNQDMADMPVGQIEEVFWAYRQRMIELQSDFRFRYVIIFKNQGSAAGASLEHAHSQIIALPIVPKRVQEEIDGAFDYYRYKERCVFCDIIRQELRDDCRIIDRNEHMLAFHPFAPRFPYETWIIPRQHESFFTDIQMSEVKALAVTLKGILMRFKVLLNNPAFNFIIHSSPFSEKESPHYHWHIELIPRLSRTAGFEWGTGFYINPVSPEECAERVNEVRLDRIGREGTLGAG